MKPQTVECLIQNEDLIFELFGIAAINHDLYLQLAKILSVYTHHGIRFDDAVIVSQVYDPIVQIGEFVFARDYEIIDSARYAILPIQIDLDDTIDKSDESCKLDMFCISTDSLIASYYLLFWKALHKLEKLTVHTRSISIPRALQKQLQLRPERLQLRSVSFNIEHYLVIRLYDIIAKRYRYTVVSLYSTDESTISSMLYQWMQNQYTQLIRSKADKQFHLNTILVVSQNCEQTIN